MIHIKKICIDIDTKNPKRLKTVEKRIAGYSDKVIQYWKVETKKGYHYFVVLRKAIGVWDSFHVRYWMGDDLHRLLKDILRWHLHHDIKILDICFDRKKLIKEKISIV